MTVWNITQIFHSGHWTLTHRAAITWSQWKETRGSLYMVMRHVDVSYTLFIYNTPVRHRVSKTHTQLCKSQVTKYTIIIQFYVDDQDILQHNKHFSSMRCRIQLYAHINLNREQWCQIIGCFGVNTSSTRTSAAPEEWHTLTRQGYLGYRSQVRNYSICRVPRQVTRRILCTTVLRRKPCKGCRKISPVRKAGNVTYASG
jgi:hypothetical protein